MMNVNKYSSVQNEWLHADISDNFSNQNLGDNKTMASGSNLVRLFDSSNLNTMVAGLQTSKSSRRVKSSKRSESRPINVKTSLENNTGGPVMNIITPAHTIEARSKMKDDYARMSTVGQRAI